MNECSDHPKTSLVPLRCWEIAAVENAVQEADAGLFLTDEETAAFMEELRT